MHTQFNHITRKASRKSFAGRASPKERLAWGANAPIPQLFRMRKFSILKTDHQGDIFPGEKLEGDYQKDLYGKDTQD